VRAAVDVRVLVGVEGPKPVDDRLRLLRRRAVVEPDQAPAVNLLLQDREIVTDRGRVERPGPLPDPSRSLRVRQMNRISPFLAGLLFGLGLCLSGMTDPQKVLGFLDLAGAWDPSLALVMVGAITVAFIAFRPDGR
jgi:hypothetical protein